MQLGEATSDPDDLLWAKAAVEHAPSMTYSEKKGANLNFEMSTAG